MITAAEAYNIAENSNKSQLEKLEQRIRWASEENRYFTYSDYFLIQTDIDTLEASGYRVEMNASNSCHKIFWDEPIPHPEIIGEAITEPESDNAIIDAITD
jgi:hypothetical protein